MILSSTDYGDHQDYKMQTLLGCASSNLCKGVPYLRSLHFFTSDFYQHKCCASSLCNSAWSVKVNVITLLFGLITLIFN